MSDVNSSLPVRTENDGDVVIKVADGTTPSQHLKINVDGSVNITDNAGSITVDAVALDIRPLLFATDRIDASGSVVALDATTLAALENITVSATNLDIRDLVFATDKVDASGSVVALDAPTLAALENITVSATALDIRALTFATDSVNVSGSTVNADIRVAGNAVSTLNPVPVSISSSIPGTAVHDYFKGSAIAAGSSSNHDYTVTAAKTLNLARIYASASGRIKIEVQYETAAASGTFNTKFVGFNSTATPNIDITVVSVFAQVTGAKIRVIVTNLDKQAEDVYSTIEGTEI